MKKFIIVILVCLGLIGGVGLLASSLKGYFHHANNSREDTEYLDTLVTNELVEDFRKAIKLKLDKGEITEEEATMLVNEYCSMVGRCDQIDSELHHGNHNGDKHFSDLTEEELLAYFAIKEEYLNELVAQGVITQEQADIRLAGYCSNLEKLASGEYGNQYYCDIHHVYEAHNNCRDNYHDESEKHSGGKHDNKDHH